ncbi:MAG: hypothetical protein QOG61_1595 [Candidatus Binataceae bacterium]|nr:hypothetical protein [Candidatus Binataceae bacterium]
MFGTLRDIVACKLPRTMLGLPQHRVARKCKLQPWHADLERSDVAKFDRRHESRATDYLCYVENIESLHSRKGATPERRWEASDPASRIQPARLRRGRALTEACSSSERQRSITSRLKRHSEPTRKPGSCFARSNRYTVVGCTRRYSESSRTVSTVGGVGAVPDFFDRFSSTRTL